MVGRTLNSAGVSPVSFLGFFNFGIEYRLGVGRVFSFNFIGYRRGGNTGTNIVQNKANEYFSTFYILDVCFIGFFSFADAKRATPHRYHIDAIGQSRQISFSDATFRWPVTKPTERDGSSVVFGGFFPSAQGSVVIIAFFRAESVSTTIVVYLFIFYFCPFATRRESYSNTQYSYTDSFGNILHNFHSILNISSFYPTKL